MDHLSINKQDLSEATFIIPIRLESPDRIRNVILSIAYILHHFKTTVMVAEADVESVFKAVALPELAKIVDQESSNNLIHFFYKEDLKLMPFRRTFLLNEMLCQSTTKITINYDCDVLFPVQSYVQAYNMCLNSEQDLVYPYGKGQYQRMVNFSDISHAYRFVETGFDLSILDGCSSPWNAEYGFAQFFKTDAYINGYMENENFIAYGPEDYERFNRWTKLGYNVSRVEGGMIYHMEHVRSFNSNTQNPFIAANDNLKDKLASMTKEQLVQYYETQQYYRERRNNVKL